MMANKTRLSFGYNSPFIFLLILYFLDARAIVGICPLETIRDTNDYNEFPTLCEFQNQNLAYANMALTCPGT